MNELTTFRTFGQTNKKTNKKTLGFMKIQVISKHVTESGWGKRDKLIE